METQTQVKHECFVCHKTIEKPANKIVTGCGYRMENPDVPFDSEKTVKVCYECCAKEDYANMLKTGKFVGYLSMEVEKADSMPSERMVKEGWRGYVKPSRYGPNSTQLYAKNVRVSNWPGSLKFEVYHMRIGSHNMANCRYDIWFEVLNPKTNQLEKWHGTCYGDDTQICHCKRTKESIDFGNRLEYLRGELRDERLSYNDLAELEHYGRFGFIPSEDTELLEAAGVPEHA